jgi:hypothetical protein
MFWSCVRLKIEYESREVMEGKINPSKPTARPVQRPTRFTRYRTTWLIEADDGKESIIWIAHLSGATLRRRSFSPLAEKTVFGLWSR